MIEADRKFLTEAMGECWHELVGTCVNAYGCELHRCSCGAVVISRQSLNNHCEVSNRTFGNWEDFGVVWNYMKAMETWFEFSDWAHDKYLEFDPCGVTSPLIYIIDPTRFPQLVVGWMRKGGE